MTVGAKRFGAVLLALVVGVCGCATDTAPVDQGPTIAAVIDGDTIEVAFAAGHVETVRLLGVDTPETVDPRRPVQCFGAEASAHLVALIPPGTPIRLERDIEARDHYGRLLAYVHRRADGLFVNLDLVAQGYADVSFYEPNTTHRSAFGHAVLTARTQQLGLWGVCGTPDLALEPSR